MKPTDDLMREALATQIPNLKTQAQYTLFMTSFDALRSAFNSYLGEEVAAAEVAREALNKALDMAKQLPGISKKLEEVPEEQRSKAMNNFLEPAKELHEYDVHKQLTLELTAIKGLEELETWYLNNRDRLDRIVSSDLRNSLFDTIRGKRRELNNDSH